MRRLHNIYRLHEGKETRRVYEAKSAGKINHDHKKSRKQKNHEMMENQGLYGK